MFSFCSSNILQMELMLKWWESRSSGNDEDGQSLCRSSFHSPSARASLAIRVVFRSITLLSGLPSSISKLCSFVGNFIRWSFVQAQVNLPGQNSIFACNKIPGSIIHCSKPLSYLNLFCCYFFHLKSIQAQ